MNVVVAIVVVVVEDSSDDSDSRFVVIISGGIVAVGLAVITVYTFPRPWLGSSTIFELLTIYKGFSAEHNV